jgi:hypothetical protein
MIGIDRSTAHRIAYFTLSLTTAMLLHVIFFIPVGIAATIEPTKWLLAFEVGWNVNKTKLKVGAPQEERNECPIALGDECQFPEEATGPRGFSFPESVAVSKSTGDVYIADKVNRRVQVLTSNGKFVRMFGLNVNKTKVARGAGATQQEKNLCTAVEVKTEGVECGKGEQGTGQAGQISNGAVVAVDPVTDHIYLFEGEYHRVEAFTDTGEFLLMIGGHVNKRGSNLCTSAETAECQAGIEGAGAGEFEKPETASYGNVITEGPEGLLYVGDEARVQKFEADGKSAGTVSLSGLSVMGVAAAVAVDASGNLFLVDKAVAGVREYNSSGQLQACVIDAAGSTIHGIAIDPYGRLGVVGEASSAVVYRTDGVACGTQVSETATSESTAIAFSFNGASEDRMYFGHAGIPAVYGYRPVVSPEVATCPTTEVESFDATLCAQVNPNALLTHVYFKYGTEKSNLSRVTLTAFTGSGTSPEPVKSRLDGLIPNETYYDEAWAEYETEGKLQPKGGPPPVGFHTTTPPPEIPASPEAPFVSYTTAVLSASINPEHALARYHFEYAPCVDEAQALAECGEPIATEDVQSQQYGTIGTTQEISGLTAKTAYAFRLVADNRFEYKSKQEGGVTVGGEGHFETGLLPRPSATTGVASSVTPTSAVIAGTVDPAGRPATYLFELGLFQGSATQYGVVSSGSAGSGSTPMAETLGLSGLQPGTTYAYRIAVKSGYLSGSNSELAGNVGVFTTTGLPEVIPTLPPAAILPVTLKFPKLSPSPTVKCKHGYRRDKHGHCVKIRKGHRAKLVRLPKRGGMATVRVAGVVVEARP